MGFFNYLEREVEHPFRFNKEEESADIELFKDLFAESTYLYGSDLIYIRVDHFRKEDAFGEHLSKVLKDGTPMRGFVEQTQQWDGMGELYSKFGLRNQEEMTVHIPKLIFEQLEWGPQQGDIIYQVVTKSLWEVESRPDDKDPSFHPLGQFISYQIHCKSYVHDHADVSEEFRADEDENIDLIENTLFNEDEEETVAKKDVTNKNDFIEEIKGDFIDDSEKDPLGF